MMVECPFPGQEDQPPMPLGVLMNTDVGKRVATKGLLTYDKLKDLPGLSESEALSAAFMGGVIVDQKGEPVQASEEQVKVALEKQISDAETKHTRDTQSPTEQDPTAPIKKDGEALIVEHTEQQISPGIDQVEVEDGISGRVIEELAEQSEASEPIVEANSSEQQNTSAASETEIIAIRQEQERAANAFTERSVGSESPENNTASISDENPIDIARAAVEAARNPSLVQEELKNTSTGNTNEVPVFKAEPVPAAVVEARNVVAASFEEVVAGQYSESEDIPAFEFEGEVVAEQGSVELNDEHDIEIETEIAQEEAGPGVVLLERPLSEDIDQSAEQVPKTLAATITESIVEHRHEEMDEVKQEQTELLVSTLPETMQTAIAEYIDTAEPDEAEAAESLVVNIAAAADRLNELMMTDRQETEEAEKIEEVIIDWYQELAQKIGVELEPEDIKLFIEHIKDKNYKFINEDNLEVNIDDQTKPEINPSTVHLNADADLSESELRQRLGYLVVKRVG